jgi:ankyrin repeat protein
MQCALNAKSMPGCAPNQRHNRLFCKGKLVVKFRDGHFGRSITEVDHKAGNFHQIRWPCSSGASVNGTGAGSPPLNIAAAKGETSVTEFLIQHGAAINRIGVNGLTALDGAVRQRQLDTVKVLLAHGANPNHAVGGGARILDIVSHSSKPVDQAIAKELRKYGAVGTLPPAPK